MVPSGRRHRDGADPHGRRRRRRSVWTVAWVLAALAGATVLGTLTVLGVAALTGRSGLALIAGGCVQLAAAAGGLRLVLPPSRHRRRAAAAAAATLLALSALAVLVPLSDPPAVPAPVPGEARWRLATGSDIRYVHLPAQGPVRPAPVVFLHGGPGIADLAGEAAFIGRLTADGFDVYVYDQLGAGGSTRLPDPTGYGVERDVDDLERIRRRIGADRMILVGHSYGGTLAGHYLAAHPGHVAKLVLISPGALDPGDTSGSRATAGLGLGARLHSYAAALTPRALLGYLLLLVDPHAAHGYFPDAEADARNDTILTSTEPALHCTPAQADGPVRGSGFYRLQYPQSPSAPPPKDPRPALTGLPTPVLIFKGSCDYLSWHSALDYRAALPNTTLIYLPGAGHNLHEDRPDAVLAATRAFLDDQPLPLAPDPSPAVPADYRGPP